MSNKRSAYYLFATLVTTALIIGCSGLPRTSGGTANNPVPTLGSVAPTFASMGSATFTLTVTGTNFNSHSVVQWNGSARTTTFVSSTQLQAQVTAADIASSGTVSVTVSNPAPGGGTSSGVSFAIDNPAPTATSLTPNSAVAGGAGVSLTVTGTNFVPTSTLQWNGSPRSTTFVSSTSLHATITSTDISAATTASVTVLNPAPGGGSSAALTFTISPGAGPGPTAITLLTPGSAIKAGAAFTLNVSGTNFAPSSLVQWNGTTRPTTFVSATALQAAITSADISTVGVAKITVTTNGSASAPYTFLVGNPGATDFAVISITQAAQDIVYDPLNQVLYLSVKGTAATHPNTISILDPTTASITSAQPAGSNPDVLAISDNSQFLYAGIDGASLVQRFTLPSLTPDVNYPLGTAPLNLGPFFALDLQVAPGFPHTTAVSLAVTGLSPAAVGGITVFDDTTARPTVAKGFGPGGGGSALYDSIQWGQDDTTLLASNTETTGDDFYNLTVNSSGVTQNHDFPGTVGGRIHFDAGANLVYEDNGHALNPSTGAPVGNFNLFGRMIPDSTLNKAFFITGFSGSPTWTITSLDLKVFTTISTITVGGIVGTPQHLIRWGQNGLAFITDGGQVFLIGGNFVK